MVSSRIAELALRAAVNTTPDTRDITDKGTESGAIQSRAIERANTLVAASGVAGSVAEQLNEQSAAIKAAVTILAVSYTAVSNQVHFVNDARLTYDQQRESGISAFILPKNVEENALSTEERVIKGFITLANRSPSFLSYLGIHTSTLLNDSKANFYSILPFYRMSDALRLSVSCSTPLERQRTSIGLFFKSAVSELLTAIDRGFQGDWKIKSFFESVFQRKNYLNNRRAPRFIIMALSNLLWNLQHPVDIDTGHPLTLQKSMDICREVEQFLNLLLNPDSPPYVHLISDEENELMSFLRKVEIYTKSLRSAYAEELLHEVNIDDLTNSAHTALGIMDKNVFQLIYKTHKKEPNDRAADSIAGRIGFLNDLLKNNAKLLSQLPPIPATIPPEAMANNPPRTVIDLLIIFAHISGRERDALLAPFKDSAISSESEFHKTLYNFHKEFVKPIREVSRAELGAKPWNPMQKQVGCLTGSRLVPLVTLLIQDSRIVVDTPQSEREAVSSLRSAARVYTGKEQLHAINSSAQEGDRYYKWVLSPFTEGAVQLDVLPKYQYRLTQMTELMDSIGDLIKNYRSFLLQKSFQAFLLKCLTNVKKEYAELDARIAEADVSLGSSEHVSRNLQSILRPMMSKLNTCLDAFADATTNLERVVSSPDFTDQQRQLLTIKINTVAEQFSSLFREDSGLASFLSISPFPATLAAAGTTPVRTPDRVNAGKVLALTHVINNCFEALSSQSKSGPKGLLLRKLEDLVASKDDFSEAEIKHYILELIRITASYRETWFFQAGYGQTRSAKALIAAIKDPNLNRRLPLASIIFDTMDPRLMQGSDELILRRLKQLRAEHGWDYAATNMQRPLETREAENRASALAVV